MTDTDEPTWSVPRADVFDAVADLLETEGRGVLVTILDVEGSAYRRPGAKMVITEEGDGIGHVTAGCLEDEVLRLANDVLESGRPRIETYDLMDDDDDVWGLGVGCNGIIDVLLEPIDETFRSAVDAFLGGGRVGVVTVLDAPDAPIGARAFYDPDAGEISPASEAFPTALADNVREPASTLVERGRAATVTLPDGETVFVDGIVAPPELVVVGTGHDLGPMVELGRKNGFRVNVVGFRGAVDLAERFPTADGTVTTSASTIREAHAFDDATYVVVATHNFLDDRLAIDALLETQVPYVGLMGPHERFEEMLSDFEEEGRTFTSAEIDRIYTPIGLDLGGGEPYQIATSIVSEVLTVHNDREPTHLRDRSGHIHDRVDVEAMR